MAKTTERLTDLKIRTARAEGLLHDGRGLYLQVSNGSSKSWLLRYMLHRRERWMGLGSYPDVTLAEARSRASEYRRLRGDGVDPIEYRRRQRSAAKLEAARSLAFKECATAYIGAHGPAWKNAKHASQWINTLESYAYPTIGSLSVQAVDTTLVLKVLEPIWEEKTETATRVRQRIEAVLDWATARGHRAGENPARWRGHLDKILPKRSKVRRVRHHAALPHAGLPDFFAELRARQTVSAKALAFTILTAARSGEVRGATWSEIDIEARLWTIPPERTKAHRPHRVPLSDEAIAILHEMATLRRDDGLVFPGDRGGKPLSENTMRKSLQEDMGRGGLTVHGFRSTFRDWAAERTNFPREIAEASLAHVLKDKTEAAYQRGDMFERRRRFMEAWASFCTSANAKDAVVPKRSQAAGAVMPVSTP